MAPVGERDYLHAQDSFVEAAGRLNIGDREDDVVEAEDLHELFL
jgi:hypothetical protein